ncbi:hypothetical protein [Ralstonia syzygii]|uniref:hypothetical protein n=1 Tax=Ralstonia syzygii TaxID=28097 RepID=UPI003518C23F
MTTLFVRVQPKKSSETFHRCGFKFGKAWREVEVDSATAKRLGEEQMLEVSEERPADMPEVAEAESSVKTQDDAPQSKTATKKAGK